MTGEWTNFFVAQVGAAAALTGLLLVAISINLARILEHPYLPSRAAESFTVLTAALMAASLTLIPAGQPLWLLGGELAAVALAALVLPFVQRRAARRQAGGAPEPRLGVRLVLTIGPAAPLLIGGLLLTAGGPGGLYWLAAGVLLAFLAALLNTWVLLVEILR